MRDLRIVLVLFRRAANQHLLSLSSKVMLYFSDLRASAQPAASVLYLEFLRRKCTFVQVLTVESLLIEFEQILQTYQHNVYILFRA